MGVLYEFNWILKLPQIDENLLIGQNYRFVKDGIRTYPIGIPIDLVNNQWEAVARCIINSVTLTANKTEGEYKILEVYSLDKKKILTEQWRSLLKITKGVENIDNYENVHIT